MTWSAQSWKQKKHSQDVEYSDRLALQSSLEKLAKLPPLVAHVEVDRLRTQLAECSAGRGRFLLQGGDCAELFEYSVISNIEILHKRHHRGQAQGPFANVVDSCFSWKGKVHV